MFEQGLREIVLTTSPGTRAERLYRRRGWQDMGLLKSDEIQFRLTPAIRNQALARKFVAMMDSNQYVEAGQLMFSTCRYFYRDSVLTGVDKIVQTYVGNYESAKDQLDEICFVSEIVPESDNTFRLKYLDRIRKGSSWFEHRCEQTIRIENSKVVEIRHFDLPGEPEKLKAWFSEMGIKR